METLKIRLKVGVHEFEAEGPPDEVNTQLIVWQSLVAALSTAGGNEARKPGSSHDADGRPPGADGINGADRGRRLFVVDDRKDLVTLRAHPTGDHRDADAVLLIVYGYRVLREQDEVVVTKLLESLRVSGINLGRIDRAVGPYVSAGYLLRTGRAKGGKYRLTNTGRDHAQRIAEQLVGSMA